MDPTTPILKPNEIRAAEQHGVLHRMGLCTCPCLDLLTKIAKAWPEQMTAARLAGVLDGAGIDVPEAD